MTVNHGVIGSSPVRDALSEMKQSKLETEKITFKDVVEEIMFVGFSHYMDDLTAYMFSERPMHYHKRNHTSPDSLVLHSY